MARAKRENRLPAPFLKRIWLDGVRIEDRDAYPFCLPMFRGGDFELAFDRPITVIVDENGSGKSTLCLRTCGARKLRPSTSPI
mgnify:CR=1 FL=1